jgi:membrane protease YdiL (CAAX protease family)
VLLGLLAIPLTGLVAALIQSALGQPMESPQIPFLAPSGFSWAGLISMLIMGGIVAPLAEELFFRGILYQWMRDRWGVRFGLLASALVFGAVHVDPAVAASAAVMGFILAWVYEQSQSIWPSITIHTINNGLKIIVLYISLATGLINLN